MLGLALAKRLVISQNHLERLHCWLDPNQSKLTPLFGTSILQNSRESGHIGDDSHAAVPSKLAKLNEELRQSFSKVFLPRNAQLESWIVARTLWILDHKNWIPSIPVISGIPGSLRWIPYSKAYDSEIWTTLYMGRNFARITMAVPNRWSLTWDPPTILDPILVISMRSYPIRSRFINNLY